MNQSRACRIEEDCQRNEDSIRPILDWESRHPLGSIHQCEAPRPKNSPVDSENMSLLDVIKADARRNPTAYLVRCDVGRDGE